jgi:hypothetical protein
VLGFLAGQRALLIRRFLPGLAFILRLVLTFVLLAARLLVVVRLVASLVVNIIFGLTVTLILFFVALLVRLIATLIVGLVLAIILLLVLVFLLLLLLFFNPGQIFRRFLVIWCQFQGFFIRFFSPIQIARTNGYWLGSVLSRAQEKPEVLDWSRSRYADNEAITAAELSALAKTYLGADHASRVVILPAAKP